MFLRQWHAAGESLRCYDLSHYRLQASMAMGQSLIVLYMKEMECDSTTFAAARMDPEVFEVVGA